MPVPLTGARWAQYVEHLELDTGVTVAGSSRLTQEYIENVLGHRSGICVSSGTASMTANQGAQTQATPFTQVNAQAWPEEANLRRYNPDAQ